MESQYELRPGWAGSEVAQAGTSGIQCRPRAREAKATQLNSLDCLVVTEFHTRLCIRAFKSTVDDALVGSSICVRRLHDAHADSTAKTRRCQLLSDKLGSENCDFVAIQESESTSIPSFTEGEESAGIGPAAGTP